MIHKKPLPFVPYFISTLYLKPLGNLLTNDLLLLVLGKELKKAYKSHQIHDSQLKADSLDPCCSFRNWLSKVECARPWSRLE